MERTCLLLAAKGIKLVFALFVNNWLQIALNIEVFWVSCQVTFNVIAFSDLYVKRLTGNGSLNIKYLTNPYLAESIIESAVGLVLVKGQDHSNAMTVSFFSEVAHHPTALWVAIAPSTLTHSIIQETGRFSLAVLNERQAQIAMACGSVSGRQNDKCSRLDLRDSPSGFHFLAGALASTGCVVRHNETVTDHTIFVADIIEAELDSSTLHLRQLLLSDLRD